jgi:hypothetical protein
MAHNNQVAFGHSGAMKVSPEGDEQIKQSLQTTSTDAVIPTIHVLELFSLSTVYLAYSFSWMLITTKLSHSEQMTTNQSSIGLLSALLLTIWIALLYGVYEFKHDWVNIVVGFGLILSTICHFFAMVNSVILGIMFSNTKGETSRAGQYLMHSLGYLAIIPMLLFYVGCFCGVAAMFTIIFVNYIPITFFLCVGAFFVLGSLQTIYYQYTVLAYKKSIELDYMQGDLESLRDIEKN